MFPILNKETLSYDSFWTPFQELKTFCVNNKLNWEVGIHRNCYFIKFHFGKRNKHYWTIKEMMDRIYNGSHICLYKAKRTMYCVPMSILH